MKKNRVDNTCKILALAAMVCMLACVHLPQHKVSSIDTGKAASAKKETKDVKAKEVVEVEFVAAKDLDEDSWAAENYLVEIGDVLEISVWQIQELQREVVVRPDGKISFPLIGDVVAVGRTIDELRQDIVDKIKIYIKVPQVSINIIEFGGKKVAVLGEVGSPGLVRFNGPTTLAEALSLAGDLTYQANKDRVFILRTMPGGKPVVIYANANKMLKEGDLQENVFVRSGDIVYVPRSFIHDFTYFMDNVFAKIVGYGETYYGDTWKRFYGGTTKTWKYKSQMTLR
ncbi:MAG: polysaccharide biosynthesis/export family protein [Candidatus Omnitrophota bacterium]